MSGKYEIVASRGNMGAILKKDGKLYYSWGPDIWEPIAEKDLQDFRAGEVQVYIERGGYIPHNPPTPVEKLEDWPKAAAKYEAAHKRTQDQQDQDVVHAVAP